MSASSLARSHKSIPEIFLTRLRPTKGIVQKFGDDFFGTILKVPQVGRRLVNKEAEEEQYRDLTLLMELLTNLLSKDFIDLSPPDTGEQPDEADRHDKDRCWGPKLPLSQHLCSLFKDVGLFK